MAANQEPKVSKECPFCGQYFQCLGNHLQHCKDRQGRDYSQYLSQKTLEKATKKTRKMCPRCHKSFLRLDTHMKNSASCRTFPSLSTMAEPNTEPGQPSVLDLSLSHEAANTSDIPNCPEPERDLVSPSPELTPTAHPSATTPS